MSFTGGYRESQIARYPKQAGLIANLTEKTTVIPLAPVMPCSHEDGKNVFEKFISSDYLELVDLNGALPEVNSVTELGQTYLSKIGGKIYVALDTADAFKGPKNYFNRRIGPTLSATGARTEFLMLRDNLRGFAITNGLYTDIGGSADNNYTVLAVAWGPEKATLLSEKGSSGMAFKKEMLWQGGLGNFNRNGETIEGYGTIITTKLGIQVSDERYIHALVNIDPYAATIKIPSEAQMNSLVNDARLDEGGGMIVMHPDVLTAMQVYKSSHMDVITGRENNLDFRVTRWNGFPIVTSRNMAKATEANV